MRSDPHRLVRVTCEVGLCVLFAASTEGSRSARVGTAVLLALQVLALERWWAGRQAVAPAPAAAPEARRQPVREALARAAVAAAFLASLTLLCGIPAGLEHGAGPVLAMLLGSLVVAGVVGVADGAWSIAAALTGLDERPSLVRRAACTAATLAVTWVAAIVTLVQAARVEALLQKGSLVAGDAAALGFARSLGPEHAWATLPSAAVLALLSLHRGPRGLPAGVAMALAAVVAIGLVYTSVALTGPRDHLLEAGALCAVLVLAGGAVGDAAVLSLGRSARGRFDQRQERRHWEAGRLADAELAAGVVGDDGHAAASAQLGGLIGERGPAQLGEEHGPLAAGRGAAGERRGEEGVARAAARDVEEERLLPELPGAARRVRGDGPGDGPEPQPREEGAVDEGQRALDP